MGQGALAGLGEGVDSQEGVVGVMEGGVAAVEGGVAGVEGGVGYLLEVVIT